MNKMNYLNNKNYNQLYQLNVCANAIEKLLNNFEKYYPDNKKIITNLKYSKTYIGKAIEGFVKVSKKNGENATKRLQKLSKHKQLLVVESHDYQREKKKAEKNTEKMIMNKEDIYDLSELVMMKSCLSKCNKEGEKAKECHIKKILLRNNIPGLDSKNKLCPYKEMKKEGDK